MASWSSSKGQIRAPELLRPVIFAPPRRRRRAGSFISSVIPSSLRLQLRHDSLVLPIDCWPRAANPFPRLVARIFVFRGRTCLLVLSLRVRPIVRVRPSIMRTGSHNLRVFAIDPSFFYEVSKLFPFDGGITSLYIAHKETISFFSII